ncbi:MAG: ABC transporter ATP-binding protein [Planctomycetota bacterium]
MPGVGGGMRGGGRGDGIELPDDHELQRAPSSKRRFRAFMKHWRAGRIAGPAAGSDGGQAAPQRRQARRDERRRHLARYARWLWPARWRVFGVLAMALVVAGLDAAWPVLIGWMIDIIGPGANERLPDLARIAEPRNALLIIGLVCLVLIVAGRLIGLSRGYLQAVLGAELTQRLRRDLHDRLMHLPLSRLEGMKTGGIQSRLSGDVDGTAGLVQQAVIRPISALVRLLVVIGVLVAINWQVTALALGLLLICGLVYHRFVRRIRPVWRAMRKQRGEIDGRLNEVFGGIRVVRSFARERREQLEYAVGHHTVMREHVWTQLRMQLLLFSWEVLLPVVSLAIVVLGGWYVLEGELRVGQIVAMQLLSAQVLNPVLMIVRSVTETQRGLASMDRVYEVLDEAPEMPDRPGATIAPQRLERIDFEHVSFAYPAASGEPVREPVLRDFTLSVPGGTTVALVGPSGAGKTTVTNLVARYYDPSHGAIRLDGTDIRDFQLRSYRGLLGLVQQEVFLFDGTIHDNIAYARRDATPAEVETAARGANAWEFIAGLEQGLDTVIGERGVRLSGGQRQRIAIARAMLADPAILILDEATSNLDSDNERLIQESLDRLRMGRTTFVIAHRLHTIRNAELIVVLEHGRIVEQGDHVQLMRAGGPYAQMVAGQSVELSPA